jgi:hypothetical protein
MRSYLEQINLPTREDIARLGELIVALEEKVDQLDDRLSAIEQTLRAQSAGPRESPTPAAAGTRGTARGDVPPGAPPRSRRRKPTQA